MENTTFIMKTDGFHGELFRPAKDEYEGKALSFRVMTAVLDIVKALKI